MIDHINPTHYGHPSGLQCSDVIDYLPYWHSNMIRYVWRYDSKSSPLVDLGKALKSIDKIRRLGIGRFDTSIFFKQKASNQKKLLLNCDDDVWRGQCLWTLISFCESGIEQYLVRSEEMINQKITELNNHNDSIRAYN